MSNTKRTNEEETKIMCMVCNQTFSEEKVNITDYKDDVCIHCQGDYVGKGNSNKVEIGDKVKLDYIDDSNPHNGEIGVVVATRIYKYHPNGDPTELVWKQCYTIEFEDGTTESITIQIGKGLE